MPPVAPTAPETQPAAAKPDGITILKGAKGLVAVGNRGAAHFSLELVGKEFKAGQDATVVVDGQIYQLVVVPGEKVLVPGPKPVPDDELLRTHATWETGFLSAQMGTKVEPHMGTCARPPAGRACLAWDIDIPPDPETGDDTVKKNLFETTVIAGAIVVLGSPVTKTDDPAAVRAGLDRAMESLTVSTTYLDLSRLPPGL